MRNVYYAIGYAEADFPDVSLPSTTTAVGDHPRRIRCFQEKSIGSCVFLAPKFLGLLEFSVKLSANSGLQLVAQCSFVQIA